MAYVPRKLNLLESLEKKSCFLFGPRQTGKSTLVKNTLSGVRIYNLLDSQTFLALSRRQSLIREENPEPGGLIVIDEIQRLPELLNEVHMMIEEKGHKFLLTGSSARKLRRGGVNLLGGRARELRLHPFVSAELIEMDLLRALNYGLLPPIWFSDQPDRDLEAYTGAYLQEEIAAEGISRSIPAFGRFMQVAALCNGTILNYSKIANDAQVARTTIQEYFRILEDTYFARTVPAWKKTKKRKAIATDKFYFFDNGVVRLLRNQGEIKERSPEFGEAFETYIFHELRSFIDYRGAGAVSYWRSQSGAEVDFILNDAIAIEVKGKDVITDRDLAGLRALKEEELLKEYLLVCMIDRQRVVDGVNLVPWRLFLEKLWGGGY